MPQNKFPQEPEIITDIVFQKNKIIFLKNYISTGLWRNRTDGHIKACRWPHRITDGIPAIKYMVAKLTWSLDTCSIPPHFSFREWIYDEQGGNGWKILNITWNKDGLHIYCCCRCNGISVFYFRALANMYRLVYYFVIDWYLHKEGHHFFQRIKKTLLP